MNNDFMRAPHMGAQPAERPSHNAALLIDFDNVTMGIRSNLGQELRKLLDSQLIKGKVAVQRAYADWRRYPQYIVSLSEASIDLIFAPAYGSSRKNATDIRLAIDALELVFTRPEIGTFILLSGDSDFSSLVLKLKEYGKYVIGVGLQESTSDILVQNCDEFYSYNTLGGLTSASDMPTERLDPWELVVKAIQRMVQRKDVMRSDRLKQVMLEIDPSFDEKTAGFTKFNRFLAEAAHRDLIRLRKGESGQYEVALGTDLPQAESSTPASAPASAPVERPSRSRGGRRSRSKPAASQPRAEEPASKPQKQALGSEAPADALKHAYDELTAVVDQLFDGSEPVRDSMVKRRLLERETSFDEGALGFRKFSEFLKQADEDVIVDLNQGEDGNFYLTPPKPGRKKSDSGRGRGGRGRGEQTRGRGSSSAGAPSGQTSGASPGDEGAHGGTSAFAAAREAAKRTLGRFRGGSHGPAPTGGEKPREQARTGPVEASAKAEPAGSGKAAERRPAEKPRAERAPAQKAGADRSRSGKPRTDRGRTQKPRAQESGAQQPRTQQPRTEKPKTERSRAEASRSDRSRAQKPPVERKPASEAPVEKPAVEKSPAEKSPVEQTPAQQTPAQQTPVAEAPVAPAPKAPAPKRGMGRYRSGSRGAKAATPGTPGPKIGKVEESESTTASAGGPTDSVETPTSPAEAPGDSARTAAPSNKGTATPSKGEAASRPSGASGDAIEHMIRNYSGVGRRTAEALVDRFGEDVFQVIDREPGRLTEVLSATRARAVIAAREAEGSGSGE